MSKRLYTYAGFTAQQLKNKASIPSQADIVVGSNYIDCSSVDIPSEIRDKIGEGSNDLGTIYCSNKVNKWSWFSPREWYESGGVLLNRVKSNPYDMSNFCGYNHNAVAPSISVDNVGITPEATTFNFFCFVSCSEYDFRDMSGATEIVCKVLSGSTVVKTFYFDISATDDYIQGSVFSDVINRSVGLSNLTVQVYFAASGHIRICDIPNIPASVPFTVTVDATGGGDTDPIQIYDIQLGLGVYDDYPNAYIMYGDASTQSATGSGFVFTIKGIDTDGDGIGDVTGITFPVYSQVNGNAKILSGTIRPARANTVGCSGSHSGAVAGDRIYITIGD